MWNYLVWGGLAYLLFAKPKQAAQVAPAATPATPDTTTSYSSAQDALTSVSPPTTASPAVPTALQSTPTPSSISPAPSSPVRPIPIVPQGGDLSIAPPPQPVQTVSIPLPAPASSPVSSGFQPVASTNAFILQPTSAPPGPNYLWDSQGGSWIPNQGYTPNQAAIAANSPTTGVPSMPTYLRVALGVYSNLLVRAYARYPYYSYADSNGVTQVGVNSVPVSV